MSSTTAQADEDLAAALRNQARTEAPTVLPFIKDMHNVGLIRGWRDVVSINEPKRTEGWVQACPFEPPPKPQIKER